MACIFASSFGIGAKSSWVFTRCCNRSIPFYFPSKYLCGIPCLSAVRYPKWRREPDYLSLSISCSCSSSDFVSEDFRLVSTTECFDGSFLFRFGDASSIPEIVEMNDETTEKPAAIVLATTESENLNIVDDLNMVCESEIISKDLVNSLEVESESFSSIGESTLPSETDNFLNQMPVSVEDTNGLSNDVLEINENNIVRASAVSEGADPLSMRINNEGKSNISNKINASSVVSMAYQASDLQMNQRTKIREEISLDKREDENVNQPMDPESFFEQFKDPNISEKEENKAPCRSSSGITAQETVLNEQNVCEKENNELGHLSMSESKAQEKVTIFNDGNSEDIGDGDQIMVTHVSTISNDEPVLNGEINRSLLKVSNGADRLESSNEEISSDCDLHKEDVEKESSLRTRDMDVGGNLKGEEILTNVLILLSGAASLSHPSKALAGGENAYFVVSNWLGVADGIGQWTLEGTKVGGFARDLMENCKRSILDSKNDSIQKPAELIAICASETQASGSATVVVGYFDGQAFHVANIGDSGFFIIRNGAVVKRSSFMFHEFNFPIQIQKGGDATTMTEEYKLELDEGDVIIAATDALFDNLYEQEIVSILLKSVQANLKPLDIAQVLAARAQEVGSLTSARSPFADAAQVAGYVGYTGGKLDDVAVIVSFVQRREEEVLL